MKRNQDFDVKYDCENCDLTWQCCIIVGDAEDPIYCPKFDKRTHLCTIYEKRPLACQAYQCSAPLKVLKVAVISSHDKVIDAWFVNSNLIRFVDGRSDIEVVVIKDSEMDKHLTKRYEGKETKIHRVDPPNWEMYGNGGGAVCNKAIENMSNYGLFFWIGQTSDIKDLIGRFDDSGKKYVLFRRQK